ncbi:MAG: hypothetical protein HY291_22285 [Planctomycetes bacterium]|nr:hypothetical protein [Planctomycetota bacterium]
MTKTLLCLLTMAPAATVMVAAWAAVVSGPTAAGVAPAEWPPVPCDPPAGLDKADGRKLDAFRHGARKEWGYPANKELSFQLYVVHPRNDREGAPLYVVLHSAGHNAESCIKDGHQRAPDGAYNNHGLYRAPNDFYGLYQQGDAWWGRDDGAVEKRVLDAVAWAVAQYKIDPNRIYLCGISMGGSGSLGIGMRHGEVFAAEMVWVPADTGHVARNMFFGKKTPPEAEIPDPPVLVNMSAQNDNWSKDQDVLLKGVLEKKFAMVLGWAPIGHTGDTRAYTKNCGAVMAFPWLEIRRNEAYPVFLGASSDQKPPWLNRQDADEKGQLNVYFRWKTVQDDASAFAMRLWLEEPANTQSPYAMPKESTTNITFRRLQKFKVPPGKACAWELVRDGKTLASGLVQPDESGLLTLPKITVTSAPLEARLKLK